jgi:hypothetical protein
MHNFMIVARACFGHRVDIEAIGRFNATVRRWLRSLSGGPANR